MNKRKQADRFAAIVESGQSVNRPSNLLNETVAEPQARPAAKGQREKGRSHPDNKENFTSTTVYIDKNIHKQTKLAMIEEGRELSELVEALLKDWLDSRALDK